MVEKRLASSQTESKHQASVCTAGSHLVSLKADVSQPERGTFQYQSVPLYRKHVSNVTRAFSLSVLPSLRSHPSRLLVLPQRAWTNPKWAQHVGKQAHLRRGTSFSACTGVSSADWQCWLNSARRTCTCFFCSCLVSDGPLGSSCFCAGPRQKPCVSKRHEKHHRKLHGPAEGVEL